MNKDLLERLKAQFELSTGHAASSYGMPVLLDRGEPVGAADLIEIDGEYMTGAEIKAVIDER